MFDTTQSLEQLENDRWAEASNDTRLIKTVHELRQKPLRDFSIEDLRIMIGQQVGLEYLVPLALTALAENPLVEGEFYPGDLLKNTLNISHDFWRDHAQMRADMEAIATRARPLIGQIEHSARKLVTEAMSFFAKGTR